MHSLPIRKLRNFESAFTNKYTTLDVRYKCNTANFDLLHNIDRAARVKAMQPVQTTASFISPYREIQRGAGPVPVPFKKEIYSMWPLAWCSPEMGWCCSTHPSVLSTSHPRTGLFMAQCMAHKKESTLHNYCLINWPIFYVVSEAADRLQIICQDLENVCLTGLL